VLNVIKEARMHRLPVQALAGQFARGRVVDAEIKLAELTAELAGALRRRGVADLAADLTAQAGIAVFTSAYGRWMGENERRGCPELLEESLSVLRAELSSDATSATTAQSTTA
jgi:hypothetical protein